jgi:hypothetical protein
VENGSHVTASSANLIHTRRSSATLPDFQPALVFTWAVEIGVQGDWVLDRLGFRGVLSNRKRTVGFLLRAQLRLQFTGFFPRPHFQGTHALAAEPQPNKLWKALFQKSDSTTTEL